MFFAPRETANPRRVRDSPNYRRRNYFATATRSSTRALDVVTQAGVTCVCVYTYVRSRQTHDVNCKFDRNGGLRMNDFRETRGACRLNSSLIATLLRTSDIIDSSTARDATRSTRRRNRSP